MHLVSMGQRCYDVQRVVCGTVIGGITTMWQRVSRGISLLECVLVLLVGSVVLLAALYYMGVAEKNMRQTRAVTMVHTLIRSGYQWLDVAARSETAASNNMIPVLVEKDMLSSAFAASDANPWHGGLMLRRIVPAGGGAALHLEMFGVPHSACMALKKKLRATAERVACETSAGRHATLMGDF